MKHTTTFHGIGLTLISSADKNAIEALYLALEDANFDETVAQLEQYFLNYIITSK